MFPILFKIGELTIFSYPFIMGAAWALSFSLTKFYLDQENKLERSFNFLFAGIFLSAWIGAKLLFLINSAQGEFGTVASNYNFWIGGGFVFYGGLIGGLLFVAIASLFIKGFSFKDSYLFLPALALAHGIGRVGCFLAGCCYGTPTDSFLSVHMHHADRHPVQLYESGSLLILFFILHKLVMKKSSPMTVILSYLLGYSTIRFLLEFLRGDKIRGVFMFGVSSSQLISLVFLAISISLLLYLKKGNKYD